MSSNTISNTCANCGKEGSNVTNTCNKCKGVMYCNAACKKKHRTKHKKACERRVAELHDALLFKQPPPEEDCPICFLRMPYLVPTQIYMECCGKVICSGCIHAADVRDEKNASLCPFCRTPPPNTDEEMVEGFKKRMEANDATAIYNAGCFYRDEAHGFPQNMAKALQLWHQAGELGDSGAYHNIGIAYHHGIGAERDEKKAWYYFELAAMGGNVKARHHLGASEQNKGNIDRGLKHYMIAIKGGNKKSLEDIKELYKVGHATKDDYANALQVYQAYLDEIKSEQRDEAAAYETKWTYY